jgi:predicted phage terminase large subunit-like protein|tara:strand:+ start:1666 stop:2916 length:1251 start_codon:yes stop_codon:yes gene_type:complete
LQTDAEKATISLYTDWLKAARTKQLQPKEQHYIWLILAGRGWGKTRTGAQDIALYALRNPNTISAVVAPTHGDLRRVCFGGPSGLMTIIPQECFSTEKDRKGYSQSTSEIRLFNGSKIIGYAASEPERLRGPQFHRAWADELAAWRYSEAFDQLMFGLRLGENPQCVITTTPKPTKIIKDLMLRQDVQVTSGNTFENADNLADTALTMLKERYEGTTLGRQELYAEIIEDLEGALWNAKMIDETRLSEDVERDLQQIIVAIDPAVTANENSDETGIVVVGKDSVGRYYVLEDISGRYTPDQWGRKAINCFYDWSADRIVAEVNNGGDLVERLLRSIDGNIPYRSVRATRGKLTRAEPISALYEQKRVHHVGYFSELESQMCSYTGETRPSPDRLDALVWGLTELSRSRGEVNWRIS